MGNGPCIFLNFFCRVGYPSFDGLIWGFMYMRILFLLWTLLMLSCGNEGGKNSAGEKVDLGRLDSVKILDQTILKTHDEVMPKIGLVLSLRRRINARIDLTNSGAEKDALQKISFALTKADADMMKWMRAYQKPLGLDTALSYLSGQVKEIDKVKMQILSSIELAQQELNAGK